MKWAKEKENLEKLINTEHISYEEIGRRYGVSGQSIKKAASRLGINIPKRRKISFATHVVPILLKKLIMINSFW